MRPDEPPVEPLPTGQEPQTAEGVRDSCNWIAPQTGQRTDTELDKERARRQSPCEPGLEPECHTEPGFEGRV